MRTKQCVKCGSLFEAPHKWNAMCPECARDAKAATVIRSRQCRQCGASFPGGPRAWYCPGCRRERKLEREREHKRSGGARKIGSTDLCAKCGGEYIVASGRQRYCPACRDAAVAEAVRPVKREYAKAYAPKRAVNRQEAKHRKICVVCGGFIAADTATVTCSEACAKELRRRWQKQADQKRHKNKEG